MSRALDMRLVIFLRRKHIDDLRARGEHREDFTMVNFTHVYLGSGFVRISSSVDCAASTISSPLPAAIRAVSTS